MQSTLECFILKYRNQVERLHDRYSEKIWAVLYQAETRCRLELMDCFGRELVAEHERVTRAGGVSDFNFNTSHPWNSACGRKLQGANRSGGKRL